MRNVKGPLSEALVVPREAPPPAASQAEEFRAEILAELRAIRALLERQSQPPKIVLSARQAARLITRSPAYVRRLVDVGLLRGRAGKRYEIARDDLEALVRSGLPSEPGKRGRPRKALPKDIEAELRALPLPRRRS